MCGIKPMFLLQEKIAIEGLFLLLPIQPFISSDNVLYYSFAVEGDFVMEKQNCIIIVFRRVNFA